MIPSISLRSPACGRAPVTQDGADLPRREEREKTGDPCPGGQRRQLAGVERGHVLDRHLRFARQGLDVSPVCNAVVTLGLCGTHRHIIAFLWGAPCLYGWRVVSMGRRASRRWGPRLQERAPPTGPPRPAQTAPLGARPRVTGSSAGAARRTVRQDASAARGVPCAALDRDGQGVVPAVAAVATRYSQGQALRRPRAPGAGWTERGGESWTSRTGPDTPHRSADTHRTGRHENAPCGCTHASLPCHRAPCGHAH